MKRRTDLIDLFSDVVLGADNPRRLAERTLEVVIALTNGGSGAVFTCDPSGEVALFASRGINQAVLDVMPVIWENRSGSLREGETFYVGDCTTEPWLLLPAAGPSNPASLAVVPIVDEETLVALLYVDSSEPRFCDGHDLERLGKFSRILSKAVTDSGSLVAGSRSTESWESYLERTPVEDMEREKLLLLLNRNEWNIARVARLMGVTRRTVYLRLQRYGIPRERVPKTALKPASG
jgi:GAF domain-containing protein